MNKKYMIATVAALFISTASFACYKYFQSPKLPDPGKQKAEDIAKLMASDDFSKLPQNLKNKYLENLASQDKIRGVFYSSRSMTDDEKKILRDNMGSMFQIAMAKKAKEYFALPPEKREAFLDSELDKWAERRANRPNNQNLAPGQGGGAPGGATARGNAGDNRPRPSTQAVKNRIETTNPLDRALSAQYRTALRARAQQRAKK
jgi:hypothetical protein